MVAKVQMCRHLSPASWMLAAFVATWALAGTEGLRFHELRHKASTRLFEKGLNTIEGAGITGHKHLCMLHPYTHPKAEELVVTQLGPKRVIPRSGSRSAKSLCAQLLPEGGSRHMLAFSPVKPGASLPSGPSGKFCNAQPRSWVGITRTGLLDLCSTPSLMLPTRS